MSDDKTTVDTEPTKAEPTKDEPTQKPRTYSKEEFDEVVADRDKAKKINRKAEEAAQKATEEKAIEDGKLSEVLASTKAENVELKAFKEERVAEDNATREELIGKLNDDDKEIATEIANLSKLRKFVEKQTTAPPLNQSKGGPLDTSKDHLVAKPGESASDYGQRAMKGLLGKH